MNQASEITFWLKKSTLQDFGARGGHLRHEQIVNELISRPDNETRAGIETVYKSCKSICGNHVKASVTLFHFSILHATQM